MRELLILAFVSGACGEVKNLDVDALIAIDASSAAAPTVTGVAPDWNTLAQFCRTVSLSSTSRGGDCDRPRAFSWSQIGATQRTSSSGLPPDRLSCAACP